MGLPQGKLRQTGLHHCSCLVRTCKLFLKSKTWVVHQGWGQTRFVLVVWRELWRQLIIFFLRTKVQRDEPEKNTVHKRDSLFPNRLFICQCLVLIRWTREALHCKSIEIWFYGAEMDPLRALDYLAIPEKEPVSSAVNDDIISQLFNCRMTHCLHLTIPACTEGL